MLWLVPLLPMVAGPALWWSLRQRGRGFLGTAAAAVMAVTTALAVWAAVARPGAASGWGAGLELRLSVDDPAAVMMILVPLVALVVVAYAAAHEDERGLARLVGTLVTFTGAMELLVVAGDVLSLLVAWELVGACSWALIAQRWWEPDKPEAATQAFLATRVGDLGLFAAAGGALAGVGALDYPSLAGLDGGWLHLFVAGIVLAAAAKSAQLPFSPWLFSAMGGPTSASALLHAATMVAAGAYLLIRLQPVLDQVGWFAPVVIGIGLVTALAGGVVAIVSRHAKKLLAASTSAHYGLMFVAVGAGVPAAALAHLVVHAAFKAALFLSSGIAMEAVGSPLLDRARLGRALPRVAALAGIAALALAGVPPLGGAWTKEEIITAAGHVSPVLAVAVALAGALSAFYAARWWVLSFARPGPGSDPVVARSPKLIEVGAVTVFVAVSVFLALLWVPGADGVIERLAGSTLAEGATWELALSLALVVVALYAAVAAQRSGALVALGHGRASDVAASWFRLPRLIKAVVVDPTLAVAVILSRFDHGVLDAPARAIARAGVGTSRRLAGFDQRVVDAGVRGVAALAQWVAIVANQVSERGIDGALHRLARLVGAGAGDVRRSQSGLTQHYYVFVAAGCGVLVLVSVLWR